MRIPQSATSWLVISLTAMLLGITLFSQPQAGVLASTVKTRVSSRTISQRNQPAPLDSATPALTDTAMPSDTPLPTHSGSLTPPATPTDCPNVFVDITGNVFYTAIHTLNCRGVISGTDATHYGPSGTSTRGQFAKVIVLGFNIPLITPGGPGYFNCQPSYACIYLESAHAAGIIDGFTPQQCQDAGVPFPCALPNRPVTRAELTKMVVLTAQWPLITPTPGPCDTCHFTDVPPGYWAYAYIETAYAHQLIGGYPDHTFRPNNNIRRDEMAQMVYEGSTLP